MKYKNFIKLLKIALKYKVRLFIAVITMIISSIIISTIPIFTMNIIDNVVYGISGVINIIILFVIVSFVQIVSKFVSDYEFDMVGKKIIENLKCEVLQHFFKLEGKYISKLNIGEHLNILEQDIENVEYTTTKTICSIFSDVISCMITIYSLLLIQYELGGYIVFIQGAIIFIQRILNKHIIDIRRKFRNLKGKITGISQEILSKLDIIIEVDGEKFFIKKYKNALDEFLESYFKLDIFCNLNIAIIDLLNLGSYIFIFIYGAYKVSNGEITIGGVIAIMTYSEKIFSPILRIINSNFKIQQSIVALDKIYSFLAVKSYSESGDLTTNILGNIEFENVKFHYKLTDTALHYNCINFKRNSINVLIGESGVGKSSVLKLIYRLWDVDEGIIKLDNKDIRKYSIEYLRKNIAIMPQEVVIFNDTILNNILVGKDMRLKQVIDICKKVKINEFIETLSDKYETVIGNDGVNLSGGQKQRLLLARILLDNKRIVIMDEPTSALNEEMEKEIWESIKHVLKDKTTIVITHKKSILKYADNIVKI